MVLYFLIAGLVHGYLARDIDRLPLFLRRAARRWRMHLARRKRRDPRRVFVMVLGIWAVVFTLTGDSPQGWRNFLLASPFLIGAGFLPRFIRDARWARKRRRAGGA
ncbi:MAG: hypothetical protein ACRDKW_14110 [Actinomycetota bacterium]